jgi:hypothetical protein
VDDALLPHQLEGLRRSIVMLAPGRPCGLDRERALQLVEQMQRLQRDEARQRERLARLRELLDADGER